jgi:hypothetical protein
VVTSYCQQSSPLPTQTSRDYLKKSKKQKRAGWIMLGSGAAMLAVGIPLMETADEGLGGLGQGIGGFALMIGGGALMLTSVPFFIASSKNKKRAATVSGFLKMEEAQVLRTTVLKNKGYPAVMLRLQWH